MELRAVLSPSSLRVEPGQEVTATLTVTNISTVVDHFQVEVLGEAAQWATVTPTTLPLFPGAQGTVTVSFQPPRSSDVRAGTTAFGMKVDSEVDQRMSTVEEGTLTIGAFAQLTAEVIPEISHGGRVGRHQLAIDNRGNTAVTLAFHGNDPEGELRFDFEPASAVAQPGTATIVRLGLHPRHRAMSGSARTYRFQVVVQSVASPPVTVAGSMQQRSRVPRMLVRLGGLIALAGVAAVAWVALGSRLTPTPTAAGLPGASASASASSSATPSPSPTPSSSPSPSLSPTPSPSASPTPSAPRTLFPLPITFPPLPTLHL